MNHILKLLSLSVVLSLASCGPESISSISSKRENGRLSEAQATYLNSENYSDTSPYNGNMSVGLPLPIRLSWKGSNISSYVVSIYRDQDLTDLAYQVKTSKFYFDFYNDELEQKYYWTVSNSLKSVTSEVGEFMYHPTVAQPRHLNIDGVENMRDLGGWGKYDSATDSYTRFMKQGMIYRSGRFNEDKADPVNVTITKAGLKEVKDHLKIKTEIDLRRSSVNEIGSLTKSPLGDSVNYINLPMYYGGNNILTFTGKASKDDYQYDNPAMIKQFFEILAVEDNYPIDFHCSIGKDRTGCLAYLIEGLLGFDQEIMYRDYMFTNFANAGMCKLQDDVLNRYGSTLEAYSGNTLSEKVFNYLHEVVGVSEANLNSVIDILSI